MSGFNNEDDPGLKIVTYMIQSLFPPINVEKINLEDCKRVVLFNLIKNEEGKPLIEFRHFAINARTWSVAKGIKWLVNSTSRIPSLRNLDDIADLLLGKGYQGYSSESELEDLPDSKVQLA